MKKTVLTILFLFLFSFIFTISVSAEGASNPTQEEHAAAQDAYRDNGEVSSPLHVQNVEVSRLWSYVCLLDGSSCTNKTDEQSSSFQNSILGKTTSGIAYLYSKPPAQTKEYVAYYARKLNVFGQPAYAQGIGFSGLTPLLGLHSVFRNIAYGFLILIGVIIGFMILFRSRIDPRTVVSIENAIPRIFVTLITITFSYAIVGLLIDLMYILIFMTLVAFRSAIPFQSFQQAILQYSGGPLNNLFNAVFSPVNFNGGGDAIEAIYNVIGGGTVAGIGAVVGGVLGALIGSVVPGAGTIVGGGLGILIGGTVGAATGNALLHLLVSIALLFAYVRIFIMLISAYIQVILGLIFGPLQLMVGAINFNYNAFSVWVRGIIANLAIYVATSTMLLIGMVLTFIAGQNTNLWTPPGLGGSAGAGVAGLIGLGIVLAIPSIANTIKEALKAKPAIPTSFGAIQQPVGVLTGGFQQLFGLYHQFESMAYFRRARGISPGGGGSTS